MVCSWNQAVDGCNSLWNAAEFQERKKLAIALTAAWSLAAARRDLLYQQVRGPWGVILTKYCVDIWCCVWDTAQLRNFSCLVQSFLNNYFVRAPLPKFVQFLLWISPNYWEYSRLLVGDYLHLLPLPTLWPLELETKVREVWSFTITEKASSWLKVPTSLILPMVSRCEFGLPLQKSYGIW